MKDYSCSQIKRGFKIAIQQLPKEGSKIRELFDLFHAYKGQIIDFSTFPKDLGSRINHLKIFYGMDIVYVGKCKRCFRGEYIGAKYVSYADERPLKVKLKRALR